MVVLSEKTDAEAYWDMVNEFSGKKSMQESTTLPEKIVTVAKIVQPTQVSSSLAETLLFKLRKYAG